MSNGTPEPNTIDSLPVYEGPTETYAIDPGQQRLDRVAATDYFIYTGRVLDDHDYDDAIRVYVNGIEKDEPFYLTTSGANSLITMLQRDILKLSRIRDLDPED